MWWRADRLQSGGNLNVFIWYKYVDEIEWSRGTNSAGSVTDTSGKQLGSNIG
jgi:hypothetical protein